jgi:outer membrane murein-binding lipoprotein Lpp
MRWLLGALLLLGTGPLLAQSLGDVVRQQRDDNTGPKARHVFTNADLASPSDATAPASPETTAPGPHSAKAAGPSDTDRAQAAVQQRRVNELTQRVQLLTSELADLEGQVNALKRGAVYGDPNRAQQNEEIRRLSVAVEEKRALLTSARDELADEVERSRKASVLK